MRETDRRQQHPKYEDRIPTRQRAASHDCHADHRCDKARV